MLNNYKKAWFFYFYFILPQVAVSLTQRNDTHNWCNSPFKSVGKFKLAASTTCTLTSQVIVTSGNVLSITGEEKENFSALAVITKAVSSKKHRLFLVQWGELHLSWIRLTGGRVNEGYRKLPTNEVSGGNIFIGNGFNNNSAAVLNASVGVIVENGRAGYGGGVAALGSESTVWTGQKCMISGNTVLYEGAGIYLRRSNFTAMESQIVDNRVLYNNGGGIYMVDESHLIIIGSRVGGNKVNGYCGGIFAKKGSSIIASNTLIDGNSCYFDGGGVFLEKESSFVGINTQIVNNTAGQNGAAAMLWGGSMFSASESQIKWNIAGRSGGGVYVDGAPLFQLNNTLVQGNRANSGGGGGLFIGTSKNIIISDVTFQSNVVTGVKSTQGGGLLISSVPVDGSLTIVNSKFDSNTADARAIVTEADAFLCSGGGLHIVSLATPSVLMSNLLFSMNSVSGHGGAVTLVDFASSLPTPESFNLKNWTISHNTASTYGGGVALLGNTKVKFVEGIVMKHNIVRSTEVEVEGWRARWFKDATKTDVSLTLLNTTRLKYCSQRMQLADRNEILNLIAFDDAAAFSLHWGKGTNFGAYFSGLLRVNKNGSYDFQVERDGDLKLIINGVEVVSMRDGEDGWKKTGTIYLQIDQKYPLSLRYCDFGGGAYLKVRWKHSDDTAFTYLSGSTIHGISTPFYSSTRGGSIFVSKTTSIDIQGPALFDSNIADGGNGGAIYVDESQLISISHDTNVLGRKVEFMNNVARKVTHAHSSPNMMVIGEGSGGGLYAFRSQIGIVDNPLDALFRGNIPSSLESVRSSMYLAAPMEQYSVDGIVIGVKDFPFPIPLCNPGKYFPYNLKDPWSHLSNNNIVKGINICYECPIGYTAHDIGSAQCNKCLQGEFQDKTGQKRCLQCLAGMYGNVTSLERCYHCPVGYASRINGSTRCSKCSIGKYQELSGKRSCDTCPRGWLQDSEGKTECQKAKQGAIVLGGTTSVIVPEGSFLKNCSNDNVCIDFSACPSGWTGSLPPKPFCNKCMSGKTSFKGAISCISCAKGRYSSQPGSDKCSNCQVGFFQPQDQQASASCIVCPIGWNQKGEGSSSCNNLNWKTAEICNLETDMYLNDTLSDPSKWDCQACPRGGDCSHPVSWDNIEPKFGWWKIPIQERDFSVDRIFEKCLYPPACLGAPNKQFQGIYFDDNLNDLAMERKLKNSSACSTKLGFRNYSRLCNSCASGFKRKGVNRCDKCPKQTDSWGLVILGVFVLLLVLIYFVGDAIKEAGKQQLSGYVLKIFLNYLQVVTLFNGFPLRWPKEIELLFEAQGAVSTVGEHLVNSDCLVHSTSAATLYYSKQMFYAVIPFVITAVSLIMWFIYGKIKGEPFFKKRLFPKHTTPKDKFVVTITTVLYLLYPTLCKHTFGLFDCKLVGGQPYLKIDLEEKCYEGRHWNMMIIFGVGQSILYVAGLPLVVLLFLYRNRKTLSTHVSQARFGLFHGGYKNNRFYWEIVLTTRKVSIVMLAVFGPEVGPAKQAHVAILLLVICIVAEVAGKPYNESTPRHRILSQLEIASLSVAFWTMWSGLMIFQLEDLMDKTISVALSILVIFMNTLLVTWFVIQFILEKLHEASAKAKLAAEAADNTEKLRKKSSFFLNRVVSMRNLFGGSSKRGTGCEVKESGNIEMTSYNTYDNPMENIELKNAIERAARKKKMRKVIKKLSSNDAKRKSRGGNSKAITKDAKDDTIIFRTPITILDVKKVNQRDKKEKGIRFSMHNTDDGDVYFIDDYSGESSWETPPINAVINDQREIADAQGWTRIVDPTTGESYIFNNETEETRWIAAE